MPYERETRRISKDRYRFLVNRSLVFGSGCRRRNACTRDQRASWLNSEPLRIAELKGKVVLVEFWTFGCYNCRNVEPYIKGWHQKYSDKGLVVIGVHAPEFNYERVLAGVQRYVREHAIRYPVAIDNDFATSKRYGNRYWPAIYLIDKRGVVRHLRVGEGGYEQTEGRIQALLKEPSDS